MKKLLRAAARAYPRAWRERYGDEFEALLEDSGGGWRVFADVVWGGLTMRVKTTDFRLIVGFALAGLVIAAVVSMTMPDRYRSDVTVEASGDAGTNQSELVNALIAAESEALSRTSLAKIIQDPELSLYNSERARSPLEDVIEEMKSKDIRILVDAGKIKSKVVFKLSYTGSDPERTQRTTQRVLTRLISANVRRGVAGAKPVRFEVLDPPTNQSKPESPNRKIIILAGSAIGLIAGFVLAGVRRWPRVAVAGIAGAVLAGGLSYAIPNRYVSTATMIFQDPQFAGIATGKVLGDHDTLMAIFREAGAGVSRENLKIERTPLGLSIQIVSNDRFGSQRAVQKTMTALLNAPVPNNQISVLDPASLPVNPIFPNRLVITLIGLMIGVLAGSIWLILPKLRTS